MLSAEDFAELFEGNTVTLMSSRSLRRELAWLRGYLPAASQKRRAQRPLFDADRRQLAALLQRVLPPQPEDVASLRDGLAQLPASCSPLLRTAVAEAYAHLRNCPQPAELFLVPAVWSLRMEHVLSGTLYPAQLGTWTLRTLVGGKVQSLALPAPAPCTSPGGGRH